MVSELVHKQQSDYLLSRIDTHVPFPSLYYYSPCLNQMSQGASTYPSSAPFYTVRTGRVIHQLRNHHVYLACVGQILS